MDLRQSTAATVLVGPVMDSSGAVYSGLVIGDFNVTKDGTTAAMASAATATYSHNGCYFIGLTTGNVDTLGRLHITVNNASYLMTAAGFMVLSAVSYDRQVTGLVGTPRALDAVADGAMTLDDADWAAIAQAVGQWVLSGTSLSLKTPSTATTVRTLTLDSASAPTQRT